jgi:hypothetical protein
MEMEKFIPLMQISVLFVNLFIINNNSNLLLLFLLLLLLLLGLGDTQSLDI